MAGNGTFPVLDYNFGFWFYFIHAPFGYAVFLLAIALLIRSYVKKASVYRFQLLTVLFALLLPLASDLLYVMGYSPVPGVNYTSAVFGLSAFILAWALYRYKFLDLLPMAHEIIFDKMEEGILILDYADRIVDANPAAMGILNIYREMIGQNFTQSDDDPAWQCIRTMQSAHRKSGTFQLSGMTDTEDVRHFECSAVHVDDLSGDHLATIYSIRNNTHQVNLFRRVHAQSIQDDLTGVFNRRCFFRKGNQIVRRALWEQSQPLSLLAVDIDNLKPINDRLGHQAGDTVLKTFCDTVHGELRPLDILFRLGGDEFAVLLPATLPTEAVRVAERIRTKVSAENALPDSSTPVYISVSIGISSTQTLTSEGPITLEALLHAADFSMYQAKRDGGNRTVAHNSVASGTSSGE